MGTPTEVVASVSQIGRLVQPSGSSSPVEQVAGAKTKSGSSKPVEQRKPVEIEAGSLTSRPIEQLEPAQFSPTSPPRQAAIIEQKEEVLNAASSQPVEQKEFVTSSSPVEQKSVSSNVATSKPIEQQVLPENNIDVEQFDFIDLIFPDCGSIKNPIDTNILWRIRDFGSALNASTIVFKVEGVEVQDTPEFEVTSFAGGLQLDYNPPANFEFNILVTVTLSIQDIAEPPNTFEFLCSWQTVPDVRGPVFSEIAPACDSTDVSVLAPVSFEVFDVGNGVDPDSITVSLEGIIVCSGITLDPFSTVSGSGFTVTYDHLDSPFRFESEVTLALQASDIADPPNSTLFICCFNTEVSQSPTFVSFDPLECETFVDNATGLSFEIYGAAHGVDVSTLEVRIDNKLRKVSVRPRLLRDDE